jgi:diacylglycerol kinase family enzyme
VDRLLVVTNADAGGTGEQAVEAAVEVLRAAADVKVVSTAEASDLERVLAGRDGRTIVVVGGDGSMHAVVAVLHERGWLADTQVALVPLGTGNDFARGLGIPLRPVDAARALLSAEPRQLDLVLDDRGRVVVNAVHVGVGVDAAEEARALKPRFGRMGYVLGALQAGFTSPGLRLRVRVDDDVVADGSRHVLQVSVHNGRFVGGGTALAPDAVTDDGLVDVVVSFAVSRPRRMLYALRVRLGQHPRSLDVEQRRGREVLLEASGGEFRWNVDGELEGPARRRSWRVLPAAWTMLAPSSDS